MGLFKKSIIALLWTLVFLAIAWSKQDNYDFRLLDTSRGLSDNQILYIFEDSRGNIWVSTLSGLNCFYGYNFLEIRGNQNFNNLGIDRIYEDNKGILWLHFYNNNCTFFDPKTEQFSFDHEIFHKNIPFNNSGISGLVVDNDSDLWISNNTSGLYKYSSSTDILTLFEHDANNPATIESNHIHSMGINKNGNILIINDYGNIEEIDKNTGLVLNRYCLNYANLKTRRNYYYLFVDDTEFNDLGLTTQVPAFLRIATRREKKAITRGIYRISFVKQENTIAKENIPLFQLLDCLRFFKEIPDTMPDNASIRLLILFKSLTPIQIATVKKLALKYNPATIALLGAILEAINADEDTSALFNALNPMTTYNMGISSEILPTRRKWYIR